LASKGITRDSPSNQPVTRLVVWQYGRASRTGEQLGDEVLGVGGDYLLLAPGDHGPGWPAHDIRLLI